MKLFTLLALALFSLSAFASHTIVCETGRWLTLTVDVTDEYEVFLSDNWHNIQLYSPTVTFNEDDSMAMIEANYSLGFFKIVKGSEGTWTGEFWDDNVPYTLNCTEKK